MRLLTSSALGIAALAVAAAVRRSRSSTKRNAAPSARIEAEPLVTWVVRVPANTPAGERVSLCGDVVALGSWRPDAVTLRPVGSRLYRAAVHIPRGTAMEYKVTRGSWNSVEKCRDGSERANRRLVVSGDETVSLEVESWSEPL